MYLNLHAPKSPVHSRSPSALSMKSTYSSKKVADKKETFPNSEELKALEEKRDAIQAKISQLQVRMTQTKQTMTPKIIDDLVNITEESFEIKRSIKEIMTIFGQNESHLNKLRTHLKSPQLNQAQRLDINRRIQSLLGEVKKSKEIKEKLEGVLIKNQHQQTELKNVLHLATANNEDRFNFMFEFEYKALQAESENISTKIKSLSMMEEKNSKIDKLTKTLNEHKQQIQVMALKIDDLEKSKGRSVAEAYRKVSKESKDFREENTVYNCSTPKNMNKSQALNRTTGGKKKFRTDTQFKFLVNAFPTDRSPNTKEETAKAKSPASCVNQKTRRADPDLIPRKSQEQNKNPSFVSSSRSTVNTCVLDTSASQLSQERGLTASQNSQVCRSTRKSYKNENGKEKTSIAKIDLKGSQKENFNETYQARIPMEKPQLQKQKQDKVLSKEPDSHIQLIENQLRPVYPVPICKRPPDFDDLLSEPSSTRNLFNSNENKGFTTSPFKAYMEDLNTKFEKTSFEHSHKDINESARSQHPDANKSKVNNDDSYCCYQPGESSLFRDIGLGERITMPNFSPKKNVGDSVNIGEEDDTCLFGSIANKKLLYPDNTNKSEFLRDITNTYPMQQLSNKKPLASDKDNEYHYGNPDPYYRNFQRLQDSERKNPMELVFDD